MFPILKGINRVITKGYYFPLFWTITDSLPFYILGTNKYDIIVTLNTPNQIIYRGDTGVELRFPISNFDLRYVQQVNIRFRSPNGRLFNVNGFVINSDTVAYVTQPNDFSQIGKWKYQVSLIFGPDKIYNLGVNSFKVKPSIEVS